MQKLWFSAMACFLAGIFSGTTLSRVQASTLETGVIFLNPMGASVALQNQILSQMKAAGVHIIRTDIRPADRYIDFAKRAYGQVIKIDAIFDLQSPANTPSNPKQLYSLSSADPDMNKTYFNSLIDKLEAQGIVLAGIELGNETNWTPSNGDFPLPGESKILGSKDLLNDPEGQQVAKGYLQYLKILAVLKDVRDHSTLNRNNPVILGGLANNGPPRTLPNSWDGVSINATIEFLRANGLDKLVDAYGIHFYPWNNAPTSRRANLENNAIAECAPSGSGPAKPCWITEWGVKNTDSSCRVDDSARRAIIQETMDNYRALAKQGRLEAAFYYTWDSNPASKQLDPMSIFRCGNLTGDGKLALSPR